MGRDRARGVEAAASGHGRRAERVEMMVLTDTPTGQGGRLIRAGIRRREATCETASHTKPGLFRWKQEGATVRLPVAVEKEKKAVVGGAALPIGPAVVLHHLRSSPSFSPFGTSRGQSLQPPQLAAGSLRIRFCYDARPVTIAAACTLRAETAAQEHTERSA